VQRYYFLGTDGSDYTDFNYFTKKNCIISAKHDKFLVTLHPIFENKYIKHNGKYIKSTAGCTYNGADLDPK
jgi:hypothetical protein